MESIDRTDDEGYLIEQMSDGISIAANKGTEITLSDDDVRGVDEASPEGEERVDVRDGLAVEKHEWEDPLGRQPPVHVHFYDGSGGHIVSITDDDFDAIVEAVSAEA